jgi:hypothetical protein
MTLANVKGMVAKVLTVGFLAGAVVMFVPTKADAQEVYFGGPRHFERFDRFDRYERFRAEEFRRHEAWVRAREFRHFERDRGFYR